MECNTVILVDTHIWIWWVHGVRERLGGAIEILDQAEAGQVGLSAISVWEAAMLAQRGRLNIGMEFDAWLKLACARPQIILLPLSPDVAAAAATLPTLEHRDPADRFLIAEARQRNCVLVTEDEIILSYSGVRCANCKQLISMSPTEL